MNYNDKKLEKAFKELAKSQAPSKDFQRTLLSQLKDKNKEKNPESKPSFFSLFLKFKVQFATASTLALLITTSIYAYQKSIFQPPIQQDAPSTMMMQKESIQEDAPPAKIPVQKTYKQKALDTDTNYGFDENVTDFGGGYADDADMYQMNYMRTEDSFSQEDLEQEIAELKEELAQSQDSPERQAELQSQIDEKEKQLEETSSY